MGGQGSGRTPNVETLLKQSAIETNAGTNTFQLPNYSGLQAVKKTDPAVGGGAGTWGSITGTLSNQTDLQTQLNLLFPISLSGSMGQLYLPISLSGSLAYLPVSLSGSLAYLPTSLSGSLSYVPTSLSGSLPYILTVNSGSMGQLYLPISASGSLAYYKAGGTDVALLDGGTNASLTAVNGGVVYSTGSAMAITASGSSTQFLQGGAGGAPTWAAAPSQLVLIQHQAPSGVGSVTFSSITGYKYLFLIWEMKSDQSGTAVNLNMYINGKSTTSYDYRKVSESNVWATTSNDTKFILQTLADGDAQLAGSMHFQVTQRGSGRAVWGSCFSYLSGGTGYADMLAGIFKGDTTNPVTSIIVSGSVGTLTGNITLYGVKET